MNASHRNALAAIALLGAAPPAYADAIVDWNEKAVAFVTGKMAPAAAKGL